MIRLINVKKSFKNNNITTEVLKGVNMSIYRGDMICIVGVSGSGKSTLLNIIAGLLPLTKGEYYYNDKRLNTNNYYDMEKFRHDKIGMILQRFALIEDLSVYENIALPLKYQKHFSLEDKERIYKIIEMFDLSGKEKYYPEELSGGQQQRVAIARALIKQSEIIVADEPTGSLDEYNTGKVIDILKKVNQNGISVIIASHDNEIAAICDKTFTLKNGVLEER